MTALADKMAVVHGAGGSVGGAVSRAAARHMVGRGEGVILTVVGHGEPYPGMGTTMVQLVKALLRQSAADLGPHGMRVCWLRTGGFRESVLDHRDYGSSYAGETPAGEILSSLEDATLLGRLLSWWRPVVPPCAWHRPPV